MKLFQTRWCRPLAHLAIGVALSSLASVGLARADSDNITNSSNVPVSGHLFTCGAVAAPAGASWTPSAFSFDISWVDPFLHAYFLSDRSHNGVTPTNGGGGDVMMIDISQVNLTSPNTGIDNPATTSYMLPPASDPMAGMQCDQNTAFGGTAGVGRNEITGPNGNFTVNHTEVWVGDGPSAFQPGQGHGTVTMSGTGTCGVGGVTCSYSGIASDYDADQCNSSVRVFDVISRQQTDHINLGGCFRTDEGGWDPVDQIAIFANPSEQPSVGARHGNLPLNQSAYVTLISTVPVAPGMHHAILKHINFNGQNGTILADEGIEQSVYSYQTGYFYTSIPGTSAHPAGYVTVIDPRGAPDQIHVVANYPLGNNCAPNGAALGPNFELYLGCSGGPQQVIDIRDGRLIYLVNGTSGGCDEVAFNAGDDHFVGACTDSTPAGTDNLDITDAKPPQFDTAINTNTLGAHSVAADPVTVSDWQPAAAATGPNAGPPPGLCGAASPCVLVYTSSGGDDRGQNGPWQTSRMNSEGMRGQFSFSGWGTMSDFDAFGDRD